MSFRNLLKELSRYLRVIIRFRNVISTFISTLSDRWKKAINGHRKMFEAQVESRRGSRVTASATCSWRYWSGRKMATPGFTLASLRPPCWNPTSPSSPSSSLSFSLSPDCCCHCSRMPHAAMRHSQSRWIRNRLWTSASLLFQPRSCTCVTTLRSWGKSPTTQTCCSWRAFSTARSLRPSWRWVNPISKLNRYPGDCLTRDYPSNLDLYWHFSVFIR